MRGDIFKITIKEM